MRKIILYMACVMFLILASGCEEKKENPITLQPSVSEWTCEECHTNQAELALLADYMVGGGEAGEG